MSQHARRRSVGLTILFVAVAIAALYYVSLRDIGAVVALQNELWLAAFATALVGVSVTTGILPRFGLGVSEGALIRRLTDDEPGIVFAFTIAATVVSSCYIAYWVVLYAYWPLDGLFAALALGIPLLLAVAGLVVTSRNVIAIAGAWRASR